MTANTICVIGTAGSHAASPATAAYFLTADGNKNGHWSRVAANQASVTALRLGSQVRNFSPSPGDNPYIIGATLRFYVIKNVSNFDCSTIAFTYKNTATGDLNLAYYPYPVALLELSAYPKSGIPNTGDTTNVVTIDTSNVDDFSMPSMLQVAKGTTIYGVLGNPVASALVSRATTISGPKDTGGAGSPFVTWLRGQAGYTSGPKYFEKLALSSAGWSSSTAGSYPFAQIVNTSKFLSFKCLAVTGGTVPAGCGLNGALVNRGTPLDTYYDAEIQTFFANAYPKSGAATPPLKVMGDASGTVIAQQIWTAQSNTASCPAYLTQDKKSLRLGASGGRNLILCNPLGQAKPLQNTAGRCYKQTDVAGAVSTAKLQISASEKTLLSGKVGWNLGQPETGWVGSITGFTQGTVSGCAQSGDIVLLNVVQATAAAAQSACTASKDGKGNLLPCPQANPSFTKWMVSNIKLGTSIDPFEPPSLMVFGADGAFGAWLYFSNDDDATVAKSIERNIATAFTHGIANCNNVTMATPSLKPAYCAKATRLPQASYNAGAYTASDAYWSNEQNWYPAGGKQDYYVQYLHGARLSASTGAIQPVACSGSCFNMFAVPNRKIGTPAKNAQGIPMGMAYGYAFDENPVYLQVPPPQVPSKLDPIPTEWGTGLSVTFTVGRSK